MKRLHRFILKSYLGPLVLTFLVAMFVLLMQFLWKYIDEMVGKGLDTSVVLELLVYASASLIPMALPLAILISSIMTFGSLGENYELTAMKSSGLSLLRIMQPLMLLTVLMSIGAFYFSNHILPTTQLKTGALLYDIRHKRPELNIKENSFNNIEDYVIKIGKKNPNTRVMYNFMFFDHSKQNGNKNVTIADSAALYVTRDQKFLVIELFHGKSYMEVEPQAGGKASYYPMQRNNFKYQRLIRALNEGGFTRTDESLFKQNYQMKNLKELDHSIDSLRSDYNLQAENLKTNIVVNNIFRNEPRVMNNDFMKLKKTPEKQVPERIITKDSIVIDYDKKIVGLNKVDRLRLLESAISYANSSTMFIKSASEDLNARSHWINRHVIEWHRKFTLSVACMIFFFVGAPLGAIIRKGGLGWPIVISVLFFIFYYVISLMGEKLARESLPAIYGMWVSSYVLFPLGVFLTYKATVDSSILQRATYLRIFKRKNKI